jgi:CheY-like chemotaxis protein
METFHAILLVEDDRVDILAVKRALKLIQAANPLQVVGNGEEALQYLRDPKNEKPGLILLDLNMPRMNGIEFLQVVKQDQNLKRIPVVILTTSQEEQDKLDSFNLYVAGYMVKPVSDEKFVNILQVVHQYWTLSEIPHEI